MKAAPHRRRPAFFKRTSDALWGAWTAIGLLCGIPFAPALRAQTQSNPLTTWTVTVVLPPRVMAGHPATLAVLGVDGKLAPGVVVNLSDGQSITTDRTGRAAFKAPAAGDYLLAKASGTSAAALIDPAVGASEPQGITLPGIVSVRDRFWICGGGLRGDADEDSVKINGQPALVLAASPECLAVLPGPNAKPGPASISVEAPGVQWSATTTLVSLEFEAPYAALLPDQKGQLLVRAIGSAQKLRIVVQNQTPGVLRFLRGDVQELLTKGGPQNVAELRVQAVRSGDYSFHARPLSSPDTRTAERYLRAARAIAPADLQDDVKKLAGRLAHHPRDFQMVRAELAHILRDTMAGDFRMLVDAARAAL